MPYLLQREQSDGTPFGQPVKVHSIEGILLNAPIGMKRHNVEHYADLAFANPGVPVDMVNLNLKGEPDWFCKLTYNRV